MNFSAAKSPSPDKVGRIVRLAVQDSLEVVLLFADRCLTHGGHYLPDRLWRVERDFALGPVLKRAMTAPSHDICLGMGGEIVNSFVTLYELAYFFECAFLAAVATAVRASPFDSAGLTSIERRARLEHILLDCSEATWERYLQAPTAAVISSLDADIIPVRYGKHQLWGVPSDLERVRCDNISSKDLNGPPSSDPLDGVYWVDDDKEIARLALRNAETLNHAKAIQYFLGLEPFARDLGIDLYNYPLLFNFVPKAELISLGASNVFFETLDELHSPLERLKLRALTSRTDPWAISFSCPHCGQASKRVIQSVLRPDGRTIQIRCKAKDHVYQNELGTRFLQRGCGAKSVRSIDVGARAVYDFVAATDITLYYPVKQILAVLKSSHDTPVALPATDIGVSRTERGYVRDASTPRGYGDHLDMLTSCMAVQQAYLSGLICPQSSSRARSQDDLVAHTMLLLAFAGRSPLVDYRVRVQETGRPVTDTSAIKARTDGSITPEMFSATIRLEAFDLDTLLALRTVKEQTWGDVLRRLREAGKNLA